MKQNKLEEAAETSAIEQFEAGNSAYILGFKLGAKWQQERSYSEEDLEKAFKVGFTLGYVGDTLIAEKDKCFNRWFKQFKNK